MIRSSILIAVVLLINLFVGPLTFITMPTQESWLPLSSTIIGSRLISNAFAESVENLEEGEGTSANQDNDGNGDNNEPSVEGNDNNNGKNDNDDGKEQEDGGGAVGEEDDDISKGQVPTDRQNQEVLNHAPKANAGANQEVNEGEEVTLSAKDSADEDGDSLTFSWRQLMSGNSGEDISIELKDSKSSEARFTAPLIEGHDNEVDTKVVLRFELTASDGEFEDKDSVEITIRDNERNDESEKLQEGAGTTDGNEDNINNNEQNENRNEPMTDNANPDPAGGETIGNMDNASSSVPPPSLSSGNSQNNTQNILPKEPTIIENDDKQLNGTSEIVNQDTDNNSSTETGATLSSLSLTCGPMPVKVIQGGEGMLTCDIRNPTIYDFDLIITCSGLEDARIGCFVEGSHIKSTISLDRMSDKTFPITIASYQSPLPSIGSYEFMILAECNIDSCGKS